MPGLLDVCEKLFNTTDLYEVISTSKNARESEIKKAYYKVSLKVHPDRVETSEKEVATEKFQALGKVYAILSDKDRRDVYDETGEVDDESDTPQDRNWDEYWRLLFKKITITDIKNFEKEYKESEEELADLKQAYLDGEGDMEYILENVLCATIEDEDRFNGIISEWIKKKVVPGFDGFNNESQKQKVKRKRKAAKEAEEAEELKKELGINGSDSLKELILKRGKQRESEMDSFLDGLAAKYGGASNKKKGKAKK